MLRPSSDGEGLPCACLAVGKYGPVVTSQYTVQTHISQPECLLGDRIMLKII